MSNPNLHPIWAKVLGITPMTALSSALPTSAPAHLIRAIAVMASADGRRSLEGWQPTNRQLIPGAPVAIRKQTDSGQWVSKVVRPGDALYPMNV